MKPTTRRPQPSPLLCTLLGCFMLCATSSLMMQVVDAQTVSTLWRRDSSSSPYKFSSIATSAYIGNDNLIYFSSLSVYNATVATFHEPTGSINFVVMNYGVSNCNPFGTVPDFSSTYPVTPNGIAVSPTGRKWFVADRVPSPRIFSITTNSTRTFSPNSTNTYARFVGGNCSYSEVTMSNGASRYAAMRSSEFMAYDDRTGNIYFTQRRSVYVAQASDNRAYFYFGDENTAGDRNTEPYTEIDRLAARSNSPAQIVLDTTSNMMYIAETNMGTIRQIDMETGAASVILGKFLVDFFPPISCSTTTPCTADNVTFVAVTALALYRARSVDERWLFIGDYTAAVMYKMVLETGLVTIVGGQMLASGTIDGSPSVSRFSAIRSFALGVSSIYIADNSLRKITFDDEAPQSQPVISPAVVESTSTGVTVATLVVGIVNPTGATQASRANVLLNLARCERQFGDLPIFTHLLQFPVGDDPDFQYFAGAVIGNIVLCIATLLLNGGVALLYAHLTNRTTMDAASSLKFPSLVSLPLLFVLNPTVSVGVSLMAYSKGWLIAIGVVGFIGSIIAFIALSIYFVFIFEGHNDFEMLDKKFSGIIAQMVNPVGEWLQTDLTGRMGMFFEDYLPSCWWFVVVELGMCVMSGIIEGIRPEETTNCLIAIGLAAALYTAFFAALVLWQPYTVRLVFYIRALIAGLQMLSAFMSLASVKTNDPEWEAAGTMLAVLSMYVSGVDAVFALLITIRDVFHFFSASSQGGNVDTAPLRVMDRNSDTDSIVLDKADQRRGHEPLGDREMDERDESTTGGVSRHAVLREHISTLMSHGGDEERAMQAQGGASGNRRPPTELYFSRSEGNALDDRLLERSMRGSERSAFHSDDDEHRHNRSSPSSPPMPPMIPERGSPRDSLPNHSMASARGVDVRNISRLSASALMSSQRSRSQSVAPPPPPPDSDEDSDDSFVL